MKLAAAARQPDLYPDRHLNVFVPYGTHDLDYNVTRALIATLRWSVPQLTRDFLAQVAGVRAESESFQFDLQASDFEDFDPTRAKRKVVLGISGEGRVATHLPSLDAIDRPRLAQALAQSDPRARLEAVRVVLARNEVDQDEVAVLAHALAELRAGSLPDGWIFAPDGSLCVLVEAKLLALLDESQLDRHAEVWFGRKREGEDLVLTTWNKVAAFFATHREHPDARTAFLCRQLFDYIDLLGFATFEGFKPYDFDGDALVDSLKKLRSFVEEVRKALAASGSPFGTAAPTPQGSRIAFANPACLGEARIDLATDGIRVGWRVGDSPSGRAPGQAGVDALLALTDDGRRNKAAGLELVSRGLRVRVERLVPGPIGLTVENETYAHDFTPGDLGEALHELRLQHPSGAGARTARFGALAVECLVGRDEACGGRDAVVSAAARILLDVGRLAERLLPV
jgi:hypothetical protein